MEPNARNPEGYLRLQNAQGEYLDRLVNIVGFREAAGHIALDGGRIPALDLMYR